MNHDDIDYSSTSVTSDNRPRARCLRQQVESANSRWYGTTTHNRQPSTVNQQPSTVNIAVELLNNWLSGLSGLTLFFINMKQWLLTISVNTRYRVIFACLYWKSQRKVREFHVVWKVVTLLTVHSTVSNIHVFNRPVFSTHHRSGLVPAVRCHCVTVTVNKLETLQLESS